METRHSVEGSFGSEFLAICNYCIVMPAWSHKTLKFCEKFLRFFEKRVFMVSQIDAVVFQFREICPTGNQ